jgi:predicted transcriptional regulator
VNDHSNMPWSEQFRVTAKQWVELDRAATMLEETKSAVLSQRMTALGDMPVSHAERTVKGSVEWQDFIKTMVDARTQANLKKVQMEYLRMKFSEWQSENANKRAEMRL